MSAPKTVARVAELLYLIMTVGSIFPLYVRSRIVKSAGAAATADNIRASATLFRVCFVIDFVAATFFLWTAMAVYVLLKHVNQLIPRRWSLVTVSVASQILNLLNQYTALTVAAGEDYTRALSKAGSTALTMPFAHMQHNGLFIAQMFFGLWLLPLGYLVLRSGYFPKVLGVLLIAACFSYLADLFALFPVPDFEASSAPFASTVETVAELSFMAWLLVKAVRVPAPDARVPTLAVHPSRSS